LRAIFRELRLSEPSQAPTEGYRPTINRGLVEAGIRPGRDMAIIGRQSPHSQFLSPRLTSFSLSLRDLGIALAESLPATMPAFADIYPTRAARILWPMALVPGEGD